MDKAFGVQLTSGQIVKPVSADSHIVEPEAAYRDYIDPKFRDRAPYHARDTVNGNEVDVMVIEGFPERFPIRGLSSAGRDPKESIFSGLWEETHKGGYEPHARIAAQDQDGIAGEILYPSFGMLLCGHADKEYKNACLWAYNRWLQEFCSPYPKRLFGLGQTSARTPQETVADLQKIKEMGFVGVMMPGYPETEEDYSHASWDPVWQACIDLGLPVSFHIIATGSQKNPKTIPMNLVPRGTSKLSALVNTMRNVQDVLMMFVFDGVFERFPHLKVICSEADAGWVPHFTYRMDHIYNRMLYTAKSTKLQRMPSEYFNENVSLTFQDDWVAFKVTNLLNPKRLLWASDFPHGDSTWPNSQTLLREHASHLSDTEKSGILRDNTVSLYNLNVAP
jgi:predicted TIM-barrel fold metal-dependent hydrolase